MSEEINTPDGLAEADTGAGEQPGQQVTEQDNQAQALMRKLRKAEKELASLRDAEAARQEASLSETDRLRRQLESRNDEFQALQQSLRQQAIRHKFEAHATRLGAVDPDAAFQLADLSAVEIDDAGNITGLDEALKALKGKRGFLFGAPSNGVGTGGGNPAAAPGQKLVTSDDIRRMDAESFQRLMADVSAGRAKLA